MGCAVEKPFLQILCFLKGCEQQMDSGTLCAQQANQAYVSHIYCRWWRACLSWACSIQLLLLAMPEFYVACGTDSTKWVQVRQQQFLRARCVHTCTRLYEQFEPIVPQGFLVGDRSVRPRQTHKNTKSFSSQAPHSVMSSRVSVQWIPLFLFHVHSDSHPFACLYDAQVKRIIVQSMKWPQYPRWSLCCCFSLVASAHPLTIFIPFSFPSR